MTEPVAPKAYEAYARDPKREAELQNMGITDPVHACVVSQLEKLEGFKLGSDKTPEFETGRTTLSDNKTGFEASAMTSQSFGSEVEVYKGRRTEEKTDFHVGLGGGNSMNKNATTTLSTGSGVDEVSTRSQGLGVVQSLSGSTRAADAPRIERHNEKNNAIKPCFSSIPMS